MPNNINGNGSWNIIWDEHSNTSVESVTGTPPIYGGGGGGGGYAINAITGDVTLDYMNNAINAQSGVFAQINDPASLSSISRYKSRLLPFTNFTIDSIGSMEREEFKLYQQVKLTYDTSKPYQIIRIIDVDNIEVKALSMRASVRITLDHILSHWVVSKIKKSHLPAFLK